MENIETIKQYLFTNVVDNVEVGLNIDGIRLNKELCQYIIDNELFNFYFILVESDFIILKLKMIELADKKYLDILLENPKIHSCSILTMRILKRGYKNHLDKCSTHHNTVIRNYAWMHGDESYLNNIVNFNELSDAIIVAKRSSDSKLLDKILNDERYLVRAELAKRNIEKYNRILCHDYSDKVKQEIIRHNNYDINFEILKEYILKRDNNSILRSLIMLNDDRYLNLIYENDIFKNSSPLRVSLYKTRNVTWSKKLIDEYLPSILLNGKYRNVHDEIYYLIYSLEYNSEVFTSILNAIKSNPNAYEIFEKDLNDIILKQNLSLITNEKLH